MSVLGLLTLALAVQAAPNAAQASVEGVVLDTDSGEPIAGAVVALADLDRTVLTADDGRYVIGSVPAGPQHLVVRRLGYRTRTLHLLVPSGGRLEFNISMRPSPIRLDTLSVAPTRPLRGLDPSDSTEFPERGITHAALRNHPTLADGDPLRALAGGEVLVDPEAPTGVHVRGGASDHTGYLIDGIPVLNPYHGAGLFSAWNPDALAGLDLAGAAPSPALPDALSGTILARTREPGHKLRVQSTLSNAQARVTVDGPTVGGASYLFSWRSGFPGTLVPNDEASYLTGETGDLVAKLRLPAIGGRLQVLLYDSENELGAASVIAQDGEASEQAPRNGFNWTSRSVGAWWVWSEAPNTALRIGAWRAAADAGSSWHADPGPTTLGSTRRDHGLHATIERRATGSASEAGFRIRTIRTAYRVHADASSRSWRVGGSRAVLTAFAQHSRQLGASVDAWTGASASLAGGELRLAPRARVQWRPRERLMLTAAFSRMHQFAQSLRNPESIVGHVFPADLYLGSGVAGVPVPSSDQVVVAAEFRPSGGLRLGAQAFSRRIEDLLLVAPAEAGPFAATTFVIGGATARGASLELAASGARFGLVASYGAQRVSVSSGDSAYTPRHGTAHTIDAGIILFPGPTASLRLAVAAASGRTATALSGPFEWEACNVMDQGCEFAGSPELEGALGGDQLPAYARVDLGARKHWHVSLWRRDVLIGIFGTMTNLFGRRNTLAFTVDPDTGERHPVEMISRTPLVIGIDTRF